MSTAFDFSPAHWIWAPYGRTLPNTFVLFKKEFMLSRPLRAATGWVLADSRYVLMANGRRVQFGPAPADPRFEEADSLELTSFLHIGQNELVFRVAYYGHGEGTWVCGRPGLIYRIQLEYEDGSAETLISDETTLYAPDESHPAGQYKRWYLRALQEEYDARKDVPVYNPSRVLPGAPDKPSAMNGASDYLYDAFPAEPEAACIRRREIPMPREVFVPAVCLAHSSILRWNHAPEDWFRFRREESFVFEGDLPVEKMEGDGYQAEIPPDRSICMTFRMPEGGCGFIDFEIDAPEGTIVEAMVQEGHDPTVTRWLDTQFYSWTRFICREGRNHFTSFDYECFAWLQLHIRGAQGNVTIRRPGMLRRLAPVPIPLLRTDDERINRVLNATVNTMRNSAIETFVDGMARERQQYSGDCNPQVDLFGLLYGADHPMVKRFYESYADGLSLDGYFLDSWPAYDRINRLGQLQMGMTAWPIILDHGVIFVSSFHRWEICSGDYSLEPKMLPKFLRFARYLRTLCNEDGLVDTTRRTNTFFWLDHLCYRDPSEKMCAANMLTFDMLMHLSEIAEHAGMTDSAAELWDWASSIRLQLTENWFDKETGLFYDDMQRRLTSDYTLSLAILFSLLPDPSSAVQVLQDKPPFLRESYPACAIWKIRALGRVGRCDLITKELLTRWAAMDSVSENNTLQEFFCAKSDATDEWSHCAVAPAIALIECYGGLTYAGNDFTVCPKAGGLHRIEWQAQLPGGTLHFLLQGQQLTLTFPEGLKGSIRQADGSIIPAVSGNTTDLTIL